jgi:hypothetical protein
MSTSNTITPDHFTRVNSDYYGNPRYVCHFTHFITDNDNGGALEKYAIACKRANKIGGAKYRAKNYGGGVVFQSYSLQDTCKAINELMKKY